jgi:hypothetical protein
MRYVQKIGLHMLFPKTVLPVFPTSRSNNKGIQISIILLLFWLIVYRFYFSS